MVTSQKQRFAAQHDPKVANVDVVQERVEVTTRPLSPCAQPQLALTRPEAASP